jgi:hypothetical protein
MAPVYAFWETNGERILYWGKLISITGSTQILIQAIGMVVGIITVRLLPIKEYAWFTIANTMLGTFTLLSDGGITSGVMSEAGKDWQNRAWVGKVLATGLYLRLKFAIVWLAVTLPIFAYLLVENGAAWWQAGLIIVAIIPAFYAALSDSLLEIPVKLHNDINALQKNQAFVAVMRMLLTVGSLLVFPFTFVALIGNGLPRIWANFKLKLIADQYAISNTSLSKEIKRKIESIVKRIMPANIYYIFSGQISIWILTFVGNTKSLAQIGALGKFTLVFGLFSSIFNILLTPIYVKVPNKSNKLVSIFLIVQGIGWLVGLTTILLIAFLPTYLLVLLGSDYNGLEFELIMISISSILGMMAGFTFNLNNSRGWVISPVLSISINIAVVIAGFFLFNLAELTGVIFFGIWQTGNSYLLNVVFSVITIQKIKTKIQK